MINKQNRNDLCELIFIENAEDRFDGIDGVFVDK